MYDEPIELTPEPTPEPEEESTPEPEEEEEEEEEELSDLDLDVSEVDGEADKDGIVSIRVSGATTAQSSLQFVAALLAAIATMFM